MIVPAIILWKTLLASNIVNIGEICRSKLKDEYLGPYEMCMLEPFYEDSSRRGAISYLAKMLHNKNF